MQKPDLTFPKAEADYVRSAFDSKNVILEYGSGGSTILAAQTQGKTILTVESDSAWLCKINLYIQHARLPSLPVTFYQDIGPTKQWGYPIDDQKWRQYPDYSMGIWRYAAENNIHPELVLIDGRFRVACFLASIINAKSLIRILFDDYVNREHYHVIEKICRPVDFVGRMAIFEVEPNSFNFRDVFDLMGYFYVPE